MDSRRTPLSSSDYIVILSFLSLLTFVVLLVTRMLDDNRLTSWIWIYRNTSGIPQLVLLSLGLCLSFLVAKLPTGLKYPKTFLFLISFAASAPFWAEPEVIVDASRYFTQAKQLKINGIMFFLKEWGRAIDVWTDMPVMPFFYGMIFKYMGEKRLFIQIFVSGLFSSSAVLTYLIGKELWNERIGMSGGLLLLGIPYLYTQVPLMLVDVPAMFFLLASVYSFMKTLKHGGAAWIGATCAALVLTFFVKYSTWMMLSNVVVILLVSLFDPRISERHGGNGEDDGLMTPNDSESLLNTLRRKILVRGLVVIFISSLAAIAVVLVKLDVILDQMQLLISYQKPGLRSWSESFTSTFLYQIHPFISIAAAYSAYLALRGKDTRYIIIAWLMVIVLVLQIKRIRYIIMVFPMISLMASYGLRRIEEKTVRTFLVSSIIVYALVIAYFGYLPFLKSTSPVNLKYAGRYLDSIPEAGVEVFTQMPRDPVASAVIQVPILDYFTEKEITYRYQDKEREISRSGIEASSLRFSWEYRSPPYYATSAEKNDDHAVAIITDDSARPVPDAIAERLTGFYLAKTFDTDEKVFRLRTHVLVFRKGREE